MPWLNWSLKFHIKLRTISLLISTHNTQVYVQWMSYSFMWLYLIKCVFICSIFVDSNTKRFLSVSGVFGKYFVFTKTEKKFQKQCCPILVTQSRVRQVACHSRELTGRFWRLVCKWKVESRGVHRDFHGSACNSLASKSFQSRKTHRRFFKNLVFKVFRGLPWRLDSVVKIMCFPYWGLFSRLFSKTFHFSRLHHYHCSYIHFLPSFLFDPFVYS